MSLCRRCLDAVSAMLDDEGQPDDVILVENHLPQCADCRSAADLARRLKVAARELVAEPTPDLLPHLLAAAHRGNLRLVGIAACGCGTRCSCGCQEGDPCRCAHTAA